MKKWFFAISIFLISYYGFYSIYDDKNKKYIVDIINKDVKIKEEYGVVESYDVRKVGITGTDRYFKIVINGTKKTGMIKLTIYKDKKGNYLKYDVT
ncbi:hypothetical protein [Acinetobacter modestus]|uniref:DUF1093 domain-containing protein n=1 Tax=Acinetobacter modestus TaxID=1776740 RepID=A0ABP2TV44_9GAMM|nr:hypothetical protein [Acinetobacter modestus]ENU26165.1 hypothetical protein F992_02499 [Acinetobacter modestus]GGA12473.1 hypothetical protein GCM10017554_05650 [Acinetobacter modestus]